MGSHGIPSIGRDGALRRPRRVQRRNERRDSHVPHGSFRPLHAGGDIAARCPYHEPTSALLYVSLCPIIPRMEIPRRKTLPHEIPSWVDPQKEIYFISINCEERFRNQLALPDSLRAIV